METRSIRGLTLYFDPSEQEAAKVIGDACQQSLDLLHDLWQLEVPAECRVYVMTSWQCFLFHSPPWPWRIYLAITLPLRYRRIQKLWDMSGGWAQRYGRRQTIGLKPPRFLSEIGTGLRERVFIERTVDEWVQHNTCHELVHACSDHLQLPPWLHEGLAMVTVDRLAGRPTVRAATIDTLAHTSPGTMPQAGYGRLSAEPDALLYLAVRGYWITRYLAEQQPALLKGLLARRKSYEVLEGVLAAGMGIRRQEFWRQIDGVVASHYGAAALSKTEEDHG